MLTISQNDDCSLILLKSDLLDQMFGTPDPTPYTNIKISIFRNCCDCEVFEVDITRTEPDPFPTSEADVYNYNATTLLMELDPKLENTNNTNWVDGVYRIVVTISNDAGDDVQSEANCFFLDCETSCKVAKYIKELLKREEDTEVHLLHFGLTNASNCNCNCEEMCYLYRKLFNILEEGNKCLCCNV